MAVPGESIRNNASLFRLNSGLEVLDEWSMTATQPDRNAVNRVLFSLVEKSAFTEYNVVDDVQKTMEFFVFARSDLVVKIRVHDLGTFGIRYVGPAADAPGLDPQTPAR